MRTKATLILLHFVFWLAIYLLPYLITYGSINISAMAAEPGVMVHGLSTALLIVYAYVNHYLLVPRLYLHRRYVAYAALVVVGILIVIWVPGFSMLHKGGGPPPGPGHPPGDHSPGGRPPGGVSRLDYNVILFVIVTFVSISIRQQRQLLETQKERLNAELFFLKAQINPHFLFNTLNSIYALSIRKSDDTPKAIIELSELMRYILKDSDEDTVLLNHELSYINNYIALQRRRLGNTVQIHYAAPASVGNQRVAPLIIMSFVENAFKHGINPDQDSSISIELSLMNNELHLVVLNNKVTAINREETMGIGLKNARLRLERLYVGKHKLSIVDNDKTFSVNLTLELQ